MSLVTNLDSVISQAEQLIVERGKKPTDKRSKILALLLKAEEKPLSAYDITDLFNQSYDDHMVANSVYRILDWLSEANLVHKLVTVNKFLACQHDKCLRHSSFSIFMICRECQKSFERFASEAMIKELKRGAENAEFGHLAPHIELSGVCTECQSQVASEMN
jgi:Fur family zinc uptake transcriptional regulator